MSRDEIPPGTLYLLILKTIARNGKMRGYEIADSIQHTSNDVLQVEEVIAELGTTAGNCRARYYQLTAAGRKQLATEISQFVRVIGAITRVIQTA